MKITMRNKKNWVIFDLDGVLDEVSSKDFSKKMDDYLQNNTSVNVILNFAKLNFINSPGLGCLISISKRIVLKKGNLRLMNLQTFIADMFEITKLNRVYDIFDSEEKALA